MDGAPVLVGKSFGRIPLDDRPEFLRLDRLGAVRYAANPFLSYNYANSLYLESMSGEIRP